MLPQGHANTISGSSHCGLAGSLALKRLHRELLYMLFLKALHSLEDSFRLIGVIMSSCEMLVSSFIEWRTEKLCKFLLSSVC